MLQFVMLATHTPLKPVYMAQRRRRPDECASDAAGFHDPRMRGSGGEA